MSIQQCNDLHREILLVQRRMRWLRVHTPHRIDPWSSNVLPILASQENLFSKDIAEYLLMQRSNVSRMLKQLIQAGYLSVVSLDSDKRYKRIVFTKFGVHALEEIIKLDKQFAEVGMAPLSLSGRNKIADYYAHVSAGLGAPPDKPLSGEERFMTEQKRFARIMGMIGSEYMRSGFDIGSYQVLFALRRKAEPQRFRTLREYLPFDPSHLSRQVDRFVSRGLVCKTQPEQDKRGVLIALTEEGKQLFDKTQLTIAGELAQALKNLSSTQVEEFIALIHQVTHSPLKPILTTSVELRRCKTQNDYYRARAFLVENLLRQDTHHSLESELLPKTDYCYYSERAGSISALAAVHQTKKEYLMDVLEFDVSHTKPTQRLAFLGALLAKISEDTNCRELQVSPSITRRFRPELVSLQAKPRGTQGMTILFPVQQ